MVPLDVARHMFSQEGTGPAWGLEILDAGEGYSRLAMTVTPAMLNGHRTAHGGMIFALADTAFAYACNSRNLRAVAQNATITFLEPVADGEKLEAEAREIAVTGRSGVYAVTVRGSDGRIVAQFQGQSRLIGGPVVEEA